MTNSYDSVLLDPHGGSYASKLDFMVGDREHGQLVQVGRFNFTPGIIQLDWKQWLVLKGYVWQFTTPSTGPTAGGDSVGLTGGGSGTTIDGDQPDFIVSNSDDDWAMIPLDLQIHGVAVDIDADGEYASALWVADHTQATAAAAGVNNTAITGRNLLGLSATPVEGLHGRIVACCVNTADITDPVTSDILVSSRIQAADAGVAASQQVNGIDAVYKPEYPYIMRGPSHILGYWGGTAAVTALASAKIAIVPWQVVLDFRNLTRDL